MEQTYTFKEFNQILEARKDTGEYIAKKIMADKKVKKMATFILAATVNFKALSKTAFAEGTAEEAFSQIDKAGFLFLRLSQKIGFWICIVLCTIEIIKCLFTGDNHDIMKIVMKYVMAMLALYALPWVFNIIVGFFS